MRNQQRADRRAVKRAIRQMAYAHTARGGGGEKEKARRVSQMLTEVCRAENGVVVEFDSVADSALPWSTISPAHGEAAQQAIMVEDDNAKR